MKLKRMVAFVMAAALFLSSAFVDTGMRSVYAETNEIQYEADPEELSGEFGGVKNGENALPAPHEKVTEYSEEETSETAVLKEADRSEYDIDLTEKQNAEIVEREEIDPEEMVRVIIVMDGDSIIDDNPKAKMSFFNEMKIGLLEMKQDSVVSRIEKKVLDRGELDVRYQYTWLLNGVATEIPYGMIEEVEAVSGVKEVVVQSKYNVSEAKASARTISDGGMIGREDTWAKGYTGKGMKIAIVDTGLDTDHQNFQPLDEELLTEESATLETVAENLDKLNAGSTYADLRADHLYRDTKVAYGFNYVDNSLDITHDNDAQGDHGTHVAGIAAANKVAGSEVVGVAPDAQLYIMKVFGRDGGAYTDDIIASLEDALILGADVVNMSLGTPAGFSTDGELIDQVYESVGNTKTVLAIAAGNAYTSGLNNVWGLNTNLASNPDNSTMSTPATYVNATTIASVNNEKLKAFSINAGDKKFAYTEVVNETIDRISQLAGEELEYAMVGNFGQNESDFTDADVAGKVAVVQRGVSYFGEKAEFAQKAGAIACIVYNNTTGSFGMDFAGYPEVTIPSCAISLAAGEYLAEQLTNNADATLSFSLKEEILVNEEGYKMSDFSSWGVSPDLRLEPDMTAPGGDIYSTRDGGTYGLMSGTSMASPNAAGLATLVMQHLKAEYPELSDVEKQDLVNNLLMSTAEPLKYDEEVLYSPRSQGSGLANAYSAITTEAYLTVDGMDVPKVELKDDPAKAGKYSYDFKIHNFGARDLYYTLNTTAATEGVLDAGMKFMSVTPVNLDAVTAGSFRGNGADL